MSILQRATETISAAEASLRRLMAEAAEQGDYRSVEQLIRWATMLGEMGSVADSDDSRSTDARALPTDEAMSTAPVKPGKRTKRRSYPMFARSGETLLKIAWSKSSKSEYQHKSPRFVAVKLAEALALQGRKGGMVAMDKVLPLKSDDGSEIPDYQVYVSLAWFRHIGAAKQNGRQGYTIKKPAELDRFVEAAWLELPEAKPS